MEKCSVKDAIKDGIPIVIGFLPIAMTFGILCKSGNLSVYESLSFSMIVFAGASQFVAVSLLFQGVNILEIVITTFLLNFRHFLFAISLSSKIDENMKKFSPIFAFGLTDEIFSVASIKDKKLSNAYLIVLEFMAYSALALGTYLGFTLGSILPIHIKASMGIALYALFVSIIAPEVKKSRKVGFIVICAGLINYLGLSIFNLQQGWSIIISIILASFIGFVGREEVGAVENE